MIFRFAPLLWSNLRRRPLRTAFTLGSIVIAFLMFGLLGALGNAFSAGVEIAGQVTAHLAPLAATYFNLRKTTIYGGSNEVQRNIVAERILGLPREPKIEKSGAAQ